MLSSKQKNDFAEMDAICEALSDADECVTHELLAKLADKWSLWTLSVLAASERPLRFSRVLEGVEGISQKSLTKTLRQLERDGLATRKLFAEVPPRVEYAITPLAIELLEQVKPLWMWVAGNAGRFQMARELYDRRGDEPEEPAA